MSNLNAYVSQVQNKTSKWTFEQILSTLLERPVSLPFESDNWSEVIKDIDTSTKEGLQMLYACNNTTYDIGTYLGIPISDPTTVLLKLIELSRDTEDYMQRVKLIVGFQKDYIDYDAVFKQAVHYNREDIARLVFPYTHTYDQAAIETMKKLLDEGKLDQVEDIIDLFKAYQKSLRDIVTHN